MLDLFSDTPPWQEPLAPGAVVLRRFARERAPGLLQAIADVARQSPFRQMVTPGGYTMSVAMTTNVIAPPGSSSATACRAVKSFTAFRRLASSTPRTRPFSGSRSRFRWRKISVRLNAPWILWYNSRFILIIPLSLPAI